MAGGLGTAGDRDPARERVRDARARRASFRAGLGVAILLLVIWGPVPWTQRFWTIVIFTVAAFAWLEWIRRRTLEEFPDQPPPRMSLRSRRAADDQGGET